MPHKTISPQLTAAIALLYCGTAVAAGESIDLSLAVNVDYQRQQFRDTDTDLYMLALSPGLQAGNWMLALDLPLARVDGEQFVIGGRPRLESACNSARESELSPRLARRLATFLQRCAEAGESAATGSSGIGDISGIASYGRGLGDSNWFASLSLGYKTDSGDADDGLGSGTRDLFGELLLDRSGAYGGLSLMFGYNSAVGGDYEALAEDFFYTQAEVRLHPNEAWALGAQWEFQQASLVDAADLKSAGLFAELSADRNWQLRLNWRHTLSGDIYPENTLSGSLSYWF